MVYYLIFLSILPILMGIVWIYSTKKYSKESIIASSKFFIMGVFLSVIVIFAEEFLLNVNNFTGYSNILYISFVVAGFTEEGFKALVLIPILTKKKEFAKRVDGITYSVYLSLGFATVENLIYLLAEDHDIVFQVALNRAFISIPAHIMFAIAMGYYLSKYKFCDSKKKKRKYLILSVLVPILMHGIFDFILMIQYRWAIVLFLLYVIILLKFNLEKLEKYIENSKKIFISNMKKQRNIHIKKKMDEKSIKIEKEKSKIYDESEKK
jgi:RsiW-degrading membrane proteinase PrsW (M82 family)